MILCRFTTSTLGLKEFAADPASIVGADGVRYGLGDGMRVCDWHVESPCKLGRWNVCVELDHEQRLGEDAP